MDNLYEFLEVLTCYSRDIINMKEDSNLLLSHKMLAHIRIYDPNIDSYYDITGITVDRLSCGCGSGLTLEIKAE